MAESFKPNFDVNSSQNYGKALEKINKEIENINKTITYLDVYNIVDTVLDKMSLSVKINNLINNSSLVINTEPFSLNGEFYNTGDIVLKNNSGKIIHIKAQAGGIYYPYQLTQTEGGYEISYKFSGSAPTEDSATVEDNTVKEPGQTIKFTGLGSSNSNSNIYGIWDKIDPQTASYSFAVAAGDIQPQIQIWLNDKSQMEEISCDFSLEKKEENWNVTIDKDILKLGTVYIKVK